MLTSVAHLDAHLTSDQEVADSTPTGSATFFYLIRNIFYGHSLLSADSRRTSISCERMCTILVNCLED